MTDLKVTIPFLPPSSNSIYQSIPGRGRHLSSAAQQFRVRAMRVLQQEGRSALLFLKQNVPYQLRLTFYFPDVENKGWSQTFSKGERTGQRKVESRYKKIDLSNRIKLLEDTIAAAIGVDDCHTFRLIVEKAHDEKHPRVEVVMSPMSEEGEKEDGSTLRQTQPHRAPHPLPQSRVSSRQPPPGETGTHHPPEGDAIRRILRTRPSRRLP